MAIYQKIGGKLVPIQATTFSDAGIKERNDLQKILKQQIEIIAPDTMVIAEEFGDWEDSRRRIDLLAIDKDANLVVIELKRTEDGGHMELQALRYAAMVSVLTFDEAVQTYERYLAGVGQELDARTRILEFLDWEDPDSEEFPRDVKVVLAAAEFSKEITSTAIWLNDHGLDIKCVRLRPHNDSGRLLLDIQQVIPLPEAESYQIKIRDKKIAERAARTQNRDLTRYDVTVGEKTFTDLPKRRAILQVIRALCDAGVDPDAIRNSVPWKTTILIPIAGTLDAEAFEKALAAQMIEQGRQPQTYRFFTDNSELIHANGKTYAATKMWGERTAAAIDEVLKTFPGHDISYKASIGL
jgi:hypothetical protein